MAQARPRVFEGFIALYAPEPHEFVVLVGLEPGGRGFECGWSLLFRPQDHRPLLAIELLVACICLIPRFGPEPIVVGRHRAFCLRLKRFLAL